MDIMNKIEEIVDKIKSDKSLAAKFANDPERTVESLIGIDLPDEQVKKVIDGVKSKMSLDKAGDLFGSVKKLF